MATKLTPEQIELSTLSAKNQMAFQERMSSSAHQRETKDLIAAGLNPVLSAGGRGASSPTGAAGDYSGSEILNLLNSSINTTAKAVGSLGDALSREQSGRYRSEQFEKSERERNAILDMLKFYVPPSSRGNDFTTEDAMSALNSRKNAFYNEIGLDTSYNPKTDKIPLIKGANPFATFLLNYVSALSGQDPKKNLVGSALYTFSGRQRQDKKEVARIAEANGKKLVKRPGGDYMVVTPKKSESTAKRLWNNFKSNWQKSVKASFGK